MRVTITSDRRDSRVSCSIRDFAAHRPMLANPKSAITNCPTPASSATIPKRRHRSHDRPKPNPIEHRARNQPHASSAPATPRAIGTNRSRSASATSFAHSASFDM